jgi:hypothetical protein
MRIVVQVRIIITIVMLWIVLAHSSDDPLPSWNEGPSKRAIIGFVTEVSKKGSDAFHCNL